MKLAATTVQQPSADDDGKDKNRQTGRLHTDVITKLFSLTDHILLLLLLGALVF